MHAKKDRLKNRFSSAVLNGFSRQVFERLGGRTRARTWDPLIKNQPQPALIQRAFRHLHVSSSTEITTEFSFVGMQGSRERVIGLNHTVEGSRDR
jgi:hypothetical protein